jgi:hypothetical protein
MKDDRYSKMEDKIVKWKRLPIEGYGDVYHISSDGYVKSIRTNKILAASSIRGGYKSVHLRITNVKDDVKHVISDTFKIHQLVAKAFIPNKDPKKIAVNHKDGNKLNNRVENLEWTTIGENNKHAIEEGLVKITKRKVIQCDTDGKVIKEFDTLRGAGTATNVDAGSIAKCCKGRQQTAGGFKWKFSEENPNERPVDLTGFKAVIDFPNYLISNKGEVYSVPYKKIMKQQKNNDGYIGIQLTKKNERKSFLVHRLVAMHFIPRIEDKDVVNHKDGNKTNNDVSNLEWCTNSENAIHSHKTRSVKKVSNEIQTPKSMRKLVDGVC